MENKLKKNSKKGFTLVELIVVLVILAILAALLIPSLTGYIKKAKEKQIIAETRQAVMAAQTIVDEEYAKGNILTGLQTGTDDPFTKEKVAELAEVADAHITSVNVNNGLVTELVYTNGKKCTYKKTAADAEATFEVSDTP